MDQICTGAAVMSDRQVEAWRSRNVVRGISVDPLASSLSSPRALFPLPSVQVSVLGHLVRLPAHMLDVELSDLCLTTEVCVGREDYARGVALVLEALAKNGIVAVLV
jgi:hypothetical protein